MRLRTLSGFSAAVLLATLAACSRTTSPAPAVLPHLEKRGAATQLIVDAKPYLMLGGEVSNSIASNLDSMRPAWPKLAAMHINTVLTPISWELIEPEEGKFDFSLVDGQIRDARSNNLRLVLLWFGSWKNSVSTYTPIWVKKDTRRFPLLVDENGNALDMLSVSSESNREADAKAFAALMRHIRMVDGQQRTVLMMQVENEVGIRGALRDHSPEAGKALNGPVPKELIDFMAKHRDTLVPEFRKQWEDAGGKTSGAWAEVFGKGRGADNIFMAWHYASYMGRVAAAGKAEYPLPMFVNAALGDQIGQYSSGGPLWDVINVWQAAAPSIDILSPCTYWSKFTEWCARYNSSGNPLFIPETRSDPGQAFYAIGRHALIGFSPFGIERSADANSPLARAYDVLGQLSTLILEAQAKGTIASVGLDQDTPSDKVQLGGYTFEVRPGRMRPARQPGAPPAARGGSPAGTPGMVPAAPIPSYVLILSTGPDQFIVAGAGIQMTFQPAGAGPRTAAIAVAEEGKYEGGRWIPGRRLNGDDTMLGYSLGALASQHQSGQGLRFAADAPNIVRLTLYRY